MAATTISAAMRTMTIHSRYSPVEVLAAIHGIMIKENPLRTMCVRQLILQHLQQVRNNVQSLGQ